MALKKVKLLLLKSVENLGIVGDEVKVRPGFARNYLLPHRLAEKPTPKKIESLQEARKAALAELARLRQAREELLARMKDITVTLVRSCNDQGILYGSVTQRDIADGLQAAGYDVGIRSVRQAAPVRRVGTYHVPIQFDKDLKTEITLIINPDRALDIHTDAPPEAKASREGADTEGGEAEDEGELVGAGVPRSANGEAKKGKGRKADADADAAPPAEKREKASKKKKEAGA